MTSMRVIATVAERTHDAMCAVRDQCARHADLVELRLDALREPIDVSRALYGRTRPAIVTCRPKREGGSFEGSEEERRNLLRSAIAAGAEYVDLEWQSGVDDLASLRGGRGIVLSMHAFDGVPDDLEVRLKAMLGAATEVVKVAVAVSRLCDCKRLTRMASEAKGRTLALIGMGAAGVATRLLPVRFGSSWTYAGASAPGQVSLDSMLNQYRIREVRRSTAMFGVAGHPVTHSLSPAMHNAWFAAAGIDAIYLPLDTASADDLLDFAQWLPLAGASVTAPLKRAVFEHVTDRNDVAEQVGAANTIKRAQGGWAAINTDVEGFLRPLAARRLSLSGRRAAVLGAGGAARATAVALGREGAVVSVHARRLAEAREVAALASGTASERWPVAGSWDLLVNATPADWESEPGLIGPPCTDAWVYDLVSTPPVTPLLARAQAAGCHTISGLEMLVAQGEVQAEWWTGRRPPTGLLMRAAQAAQEANGCRAGL